MKFVEDFESFLRDSVNLNQTRIDLLQQRVNSVHRFLSEDDTYGDILIDTIPAGSWAHRTIIKPVRDGDEFDADLLVLVEHQRDWPARDYIERLYTSFRSSSRYRDIVRRQTRAVTLDYVGDFHLDLVPYLEIDGQHFITNRSTNEFELSNPEGFSEWMDERRKLTGGNFVKAVRLMKYLRDYKDTFECKSLILTTLLGSTVSETGNLLAPGRYVDLPTAFTSLLHDMAQQLPSLYPHVYDPAGTGEDLAARYAGKWNYDNFRTQIVRYADKADRAFNEPDRDISIRLWREIFGDGFKSNTTVTKAAYSDVSADRVVHGEQFIDQPPFNYRLAALPQYRVKISGRVVGLWRPDGLRSSRGFRRFALAARGNQVAKNRELQFTVTTNVPEPYLVFWKVRNGGREAADAGQMRGQILTDAGNKQRTEHTAWAGRHWVDCYIVKDGVVVGSDRQEVVVVP